MDDLQHTLCGCAVEAGGEEKQGPEARKAWQSARGPLEWRVPVQQEAPGANRRRLTHKTVDPLWQELAEPTIDYWQ